MNRDSLIQIFRYGVIGVASNLMGYSVYFLITYLGGTPKLTMSLLYVIVAIISFFGNHKLTFSYKGSLLGSGARYVITHCFGFLINFTILVIMVDILGYPHQWIQAGAILVVAIFLFIALKFFVFRCDSNAKSD